MGKMTVKECMDAALRLLNQYSIAGTIVPPSYNDQQDDLNRMIDLINDAQMQIATTNKTIPAFIEIDVPKIDIKVPTKEIATKMPEDFLAPKAVLFTPIEKGRRPIITVEAPYYKWFDNDIILVLNRPAGKYRVEYSRAPYRIDPVKVMQNKGNVLNAELDNTADTHPAIPYYVAAMIALDQNPKTYYALYNVWETRLSRMGYRPPHATAQPVVDVYGFDHFWGVD